MLSRFFGYKLVKVEDYEKSQEALRKYAESLAKEIEARNIAVKLARQVEELKTKLADLEHPLVDANLGDPSPIDKEKRRMYVAQVAGLHTDVLKPKLLQMISSLHQLLSESTNDREYDQALKGALYFAWEMIRWGDFIVNEQISIQRGEHPELSEDKIKE